MTTNWTPKQQYEASVPSLDDELKNLGSLADRVHEVTDDIVMLSRKIEESVQNARDCRAGFEPPIGATKKLYEALQNLMEFWDAGTPVHPGAEVVDEARAVMAEVSTFVD